MTTNQDQAARHETAEAFVLMLRELRAEFDREAASVREEAMGRPFTLAASWLSEQEGRVWRRLLGSAARQRGIMRELLAFWGLPADVRAAYAGHVRQFDDVLHVFAGVLLRSACGRRDVKEYQRALTALAVCDEGRDWRGTLARFCLYWHAGVLLGVDCGRIFEALAGSATPGAARLIRDFAQRPEADQRLDAFGYSQRDVERLFEVEEA